jgi:hypothetical protein
MISIAQCSCSSLLLTRSTVLILPRRWRRVCGRGQGLARSHRQMQEPQYSWQRDTGGNHVIHKWPAGLPDVQGTIGKLGYLQNQIIAKWSS